MKLKCLFLIAVVLTFSNRLLADSFMKVGAPTLEAVVDGDKAAESGQGVFLPDFKKLVKELSPAVVNISVEGKGDDQEAETLIPGFPFQKKDPNIPYRSLGSGFIVQEDGYIVTNNHVIEKSDKIIVRLLDDKTEYSAKIIGKDLRTDLALIKIEPKGKLHTVYIGNSDDLEVGEWVLAIGNQFQLGQTVTAGIVSAKSRRVPTKAGSAYDSFIQTDASINPGSSGGPLFNTKGQVIGINTAIFTPGRQALNAGTGFNIGIGFALPVNLAQHVIGQLKEKGKVTRGLLGVIIQRVDLDITEAMHLPAPDGALVADIMPDSPASKAGFKRKDVIVKYQGTPIKDHEDLPLLVANTAIGSTVKIDILRANKSETLTAVIEELKDKPLEKEEVKPKANSIGLIVQDLTDEIAKSFKMPKATGVIINDVAANSIAEEAGFMRGDIIEEIAGTAILNTDQFNKLVSELPKDKPVLVLVRKEEGTRFLTLKIK
jgi:serine protease Do